MKILYLTQNFPPEPGTTRTYEQALCLNSLNHNVTVITTMPYYPTGIINKGYSGRFIIKETIDGLKVIRIWSLPAANKGKFLRIISHLSFGMMAQISGLFISRPDIVIARVPNIATDLAGIIIAFFKRSKILLELEDVIPDNLALLGISERSLFSRVLTVYYKIIFRLVDIIAVIGSGPRDVLIQKGVSTEKILLWPNAASLWNEKDNYDSGLRKKLNIENRFVVLYSGSFSPYYDVPNIIAAAEKLKKRLPEIIFILTGSGYDWEKVRQTIVDNDTNNVILAGVVPQSELYSYFHTADLFLNSLAGKAIPKCYYNHLSAKICEYLMSGRPVISIEDAPVSGKILEETGAGLSVPTHNPEALADKIAFFACNREEAMLYGKRARDFALSQLEREAVTEKFCRELFPVLGLK